MSFTEAEKTKIRKFGGWPARYLATDSQLERALSAIETDADREGEVRTLLGYCTAIDERIRSEPGGDAGVFSRLKAVKVGDIELDGALELSQLRSMGRQYTSQIYSLLGVEVRHDVWAGSLPRFRTGYYGPLGGGGGRMPFG